VIEGACRHFVKDRCELSGMRWSQAGAENLLHLRAVAENDDWEAYHLFRKRQRHTRLYASPFPDQSVVEMQALDDDHLPKPHSTGTTGTQLIPAPQPIKSHHQMHYQELPLAA
jgi:hypothetical protein